jgi:hypothetical protein
LCNTKGTPTRRLFGATTKPLGNDVPGPVERAACVAAAEPDRAVATIASTAHAVLVKDAMGRRMARL